mmetsp:Transcript_13948/g.17559  ORF Transcript_13948/g.17559 Transcript_13948/m.17559 type:complete len:121 (-) Transcript_13948:128-490(-)
MSTSTPTSPTPKPPSTPTSAAATTTTTTTTPMTKIRVHFVAVGSAPLMKKKKFQIGAHEQFAAVTAFLRRILKLNDGESLFLYVNSAFVPSPDERIADLHDCFNVRGELVINYSLQEAWG